MEEIKRANLVIYNTLNRKKEKFSPLHPPMVGMYVCGPTVYSDVHLGNCRTFISFDLIYRYLLHLGYKVRYVRNITDAGHLEGDMDEGEDKFAKNIAKHIVAARQKKPIETTGELTEVIKAAIPAKIRMNTGHPSKKTFQAIRIELNRELEVLRDNLDDMIDLLNEDGRICIITFHSLEDRIVKTIFKKNEDPCTCPRNLPVCVCGKKSKGRVVTRKPILPSEEELEYNKRSKSAKLRVFERGSEG